MTPPPSGAPSPAPQPGAGGDLPSAAPANPRQQVLAQMYEVAKKLAQEDPVLSAGMSKVAEGIQEAQTAMLTGAPQPGPDQNPPY